MEFTVKQPALQKELEVLQGVVERKNTVPILGNVLLLADDEGLELLATDLEVSVRSRTEAAVKSPGGISVSARKLYEIIRLLPDNNVTVKDDGQSWVTITCGKSRFRIMGLPKDDFPTLPSSGKTTQVKIPGALLRKMIEKVIFAVTPDDSRFALNGALMILGTKAIALVASDGFRLAHVTEDLDKGPAEEERILVPRKALSEIARITSSSDQDVFYCRKDNHLFFHIGRTHLSSRLLEGTFPNFEKVIPRGNDKAVEFESAVLSTGLNRVSVLANEKSRAVKLSLKSGKAEVSSRNPEMGEANEVLATDYSGEDVEIGFNAKYLLDFLAVVGTEKVRIELKDEVSQGVLKPGGEAKGEYTYVIMPMRI